MDLPRGKNLVTEIIEILEFSENEMNKIKDLKKSEDRQKKDAEQKKGKLKVEQEVVSVEQEVVNVLDQINFRLRAFMASMITSPISGRLFLPSLSACVEKNEVDKSMHDQLYLQKLKEMQVYQWA